MAMTLMLIAPASALAEPPSWESALTAEEAARRQRQQLVRATGIDCRGASDEIVVCGRRSSETGLALSTRGERQRLVAGEPSSGMAALRVGDRSCAESRQCGAFVNFFKVGKVLVKAGKHLLDRDE
jgi:hypothetical protein